MSPVTFPKACNNKSTGPYLGPARCKSLILRVSCQCKLRRHQMFFSPPTAFLLRLFQMAVCREEQPQRASPLVRADTRGMSVQKYLSHKQVEQGFSHALRLTALSAVYNNSRYKGNLKKKTQKNSEEKNIIKEN